jgi:hypothetical protein
LEIFGEERVIARLPAALPPGVWLVEEEGCHVLVDENWQGDDKWEEVEVSGREVVRSAPS